MTFSMPDRNPSPEEELRFAADLRIADELLSPDFYKRGRALSVVRLLAAIWLAVERLRQDVQASAAAGAWGASEFAAKAKGKELGIDARPGESMQDYRARIAAALNE